MTEEEFWRLIGVLEGSVDQQAVKRLATLLARQGAAATFAFADRLVEALFRLDRRELAEQPFQDTDGPSVVPLGESADAFLYARCAVVAAGRKVFDAVLAEPAKFARAWDLAAEALLEVAPQAYHQATGKHWRHQESVSYESGSNPDGWAPPTDDAERHAASTWLADSWLVDVSVAISDTNPPDEPYLNHPDRIMFEVVSEVSTRLTEIIMETPGLPPGLEGVQVSLLLADNWDLVIRADDGEDIDAAPFPPVTVQTNGRVEKSWSDAEQDRAVLGLAAHAVVQMLDRRGGSSPETRAAMSSLVDQARDLVPFP